MRTQELRRRFDEWELRTRECQVWPDRVDLEPPFEPMFPERRVRAGIIDDSRLPSIRDRLFGKRIETPAELSSEPLVANHSSYRGATIELQLLLPEGYTVKGGVVARLLDAMQHLEHPLSFELIGNQKSVVCQLCCSLADRPAVQGALRAYLPESKIRERNGYFSEQWQEDQEGVGTILSLAPRERVFRTLARDVKLDLDPLVGVVGNLCTLGKGEFAFVQVLFHPARHAWGEELEDFASKIDDVDKVLPQIRSKFSEPIYAVAIRVGAVAADDEQAGSIASSLAGAVHISTRSEENELHILEPGEYSFDTEVFDVLERQTHRSGFLLSASELLTIVHPPSASVRSEKLLRQGNRTKAAPPSTAARGLVLGVNEHDGDERAVTLTTSERLRHSYIIGASGTGKSTLLLSMAIQDIEAGNGFAVLDPHGYLIDDILARIPPGRAHDVILFDPADEEFPIGFNILSAHSELEKTLLSSDLVGVFRRLSTSFGDQMMTVLGNAILAFLESSEGGSLLDLRHFLVDKAFRARFLETVQDPEVVHYWEREFPLLKGSPQAPLLTRLNTFLRPKLIRHMVAQREDRLDMRSAMDGRKILLARLSHGAIGEENAHLLGSLLVAKIAEAAMSRQDEEAAKRVPFLLYIDEFHHFVTPSISSILSGARKYGLGLILAHQEMRQLKSRSEEVMSAVLGNVYTRIVFRLGDQDARSLADGLSFFEASDLQNLGTGQAIARVERPDFDFNLKTVPVPKVDERIASQRRNASRDLSRSQFATPRADIDAVLREDREVSLGSEAPTEPKAKHRSERTTTSAPAPSPQPAIAALPGRGGPQHKYLQSLVKKLAEDRGFAVSLERTVLDGHGHVDVLLERDSLRIGCEISVSTRLGHELGNLTKCLAAGFDYAVLLAVDERILVRARQDLAVADDRLRFMAPDALIAFLDEFDAAVQTRHSAPKGQEAQSAKTAMPVAGETKRMLIARDAATYVGLATQTLAKLRVAGDSPPYYKVGRQVLYDRDDLDAWLAVRRRRSTSDGSGRVARLNKALS